MNILVAVDRSDESQNALERALEIAETADAQVTAVHVSEEDTADETILEEATEQAREQDLVIETRHLVGDPIEKIPNYAESNDIDVIYVGHRGLPQKGEQASDEDRDTLGSVARGILENTTVPVTVFDKQI